MSEYIAIVLTEHSSRWNRRNKESISEVFEFSANMSYNEIIDNVKRYRPEAVNAVIRKVEVLESRSYNLITGDYGVAVKERSSNE